MHLEVVFGLLLCCLQVVQCVIKLGFNDFNANDFQNIKSLEGFKSVYGKPFATIDISKADENEKTALIEFIIKSRRENEKNKEEDKEFYTVDLRDKIRRLDKNMAYRIPFRPVGLKSSIAGTLKSVLPMLMNAKKFTSQVKNGVNSVQAKANEELSNLLNAPLSFASILSKIKRKANRGGYDGVPAFPSLAN